MHVVDASVWVGRFVPSDAHYQASRTWLGALVDRGQPIVAPALAPVEVAGAVARVTGLSETGIRAASLMQRLPNVRLVPVDAELAQLGVQVAADLRLRGGDALYVALARRLGVPLVTWDEEQRQRGGQAVTAITPQEALRG